MFLNYRIYKLENQLNRAEEYRDWTSRQVKDDNLDGQAYLAMLEDNLRTLRKKLEKLRARRYYSNLLKNG